MVCLWLESISSSFCSCLFHMIYLKLTEELTCWEFAPSCCEEVSPGGSRPHSSSSMSTQCCAQKNSSSSFEHSIKLEPIKCAFKQMTIMVLKTKYTQWIFNGLEGGLWTFIGWQSSLRHCFCRFQQRPFASYLLQHSQTSLWINTVGLWSHSFLVELGQDLPKGEFHLCKCKSAFPVDICLGPGFCHPQVPDAFQGQILVVCLLFFWFSVLFIFSIQTQDRAPWSVSSMRFLNQLLLWEMWPSMTLRCVFWVFLSSRCSAHFHFLFTACFTGLMRETKDSEALWRACPVTPSQKHIIIFISDTDLQIG